MRHFLTILLVVMFSENIYAQTGPGTYYICPSATTSTYTSARNIQHNDSRCSHPTQVWAIATDPSGNSFSSDDYPFVNVGSDGHLLVTGKDDEPAIFNPTWKNGWTGTVKVTIKYERRTSSFSAFFGGDCDSRDEILESFTWIRENPSLTISSAQTSCAFEFSSTFNSPTYYQDSSPSCQVTSYTWNFGDGLSAKTSSAVHTFSKYGDYTVSLTDSLKWSGSCTGGLATLTASTPVSYKNPNKNNINIETTKPNSNFCGYKFFAPKITSLKQIQQSSFFFSLPIFLSCTVESYAWDFGDGSTSTKQEPFHSYNKSGTYNISVHLRYACSGNPCSGDTTLTSQVNFDEKVLFKDSVIQVPSTALQQVLATTANTYTDSWLLQSNNEASATNLVNANGYMNGTKGVWRKDGDYAYKVPRNQSHPISIATDGTFTMDQFNWSQANYNAIPNWINANTVTEYSRYSYELENKDVLGVYSAALYDYNEQLPTANGINMRHNEMAFTSFEYLTGNPTGNWTFGTNPETIVQSYPVSYGYGNMVVVGTGVGTFAGVQQVNVTVKLNNGYSSVIRNDTIGCKQAFLDRPTETVLILNEGPFTNPLMSNQREFWAGTILVETNSTPTAVPILDNAVAHSGASSLKITANQTFVQPILQLDSGKTYFISAWVSVNNPSVLTPILADNLGIDVLVKSKSNATKTMLFPFTPSGVVIEGWQQLNGTFTCPFNNAQISLTFKSGRASAAWFDDIRFLPQNGNMKSYVYHLSDYSLSATLDEDNYASYYQYDKEGKLYIVKKETEQGLKTISENVTYTVKAKQK